MSHARDAATLPIKSAGRDRCVAFETGISREGSMRSGFRHGAIMLALVGVVGLALANHIAAEDLSGVPLGPTFPDDETTGSIDRSAFTQSSPLSDEQLGIIFLGVINLPDIPDVDEAGHIATAMGLGPAAALPDSIDLHDMPAMVVRKIQLLLD